LVRGSGVCGCPPFYIVFIGRCAGYAQMDTEPGSAAATPDSVALSLRECKDSLDSLHQRMDRFYVWASQLQVEYRDLKQRVGFMESAVVR